MKLQKGFTLMLLISFLSIAATTEKVQPLTPTTGTETPVVFPKATEQVHQQKMNFFQRLVFKIAARKFRKAEGTEKADRQAKNALIFGSVALGTLIIGLFVPYVVLASIPTAIIAMVLGKQALNGETKDPAKARLGKTFGLVSLILFGALLVLAAIVVASIDWNW